MATLIPAGEGLGFTACGKVGGRFHWGGCPLGIRLGCGGTTTGIPCAVNNHKISLVNKQTSTYSKTDWSEIQHTS